MTCLEVDELAAAYALGALTPEQRSEVEAHLATCKQHAGVLSELRSTAGALALSPEEVAPTPMLKSRIMAAALDAPAAASRPEAPSRAAAPSASKRRWSFRWPAVPMRPALGLLSVAVIALLVWNVALQMNHGSDNKDAFVRYVGNEQVHAHIYFVENVGVMTIDGLDQLPAGETYQAWSVFDGTTRSLGVLNVSDNGDGYVLLSNHVTSNQKVWVTIEPSGGSSAPSGTTVLSSQQQ